MVEPELSRAHEDYVKALKEGCYVHQIMAGAPQATVPGGFRLFVHFMKTNWEVRLRGTLFLVNADDRTGVGG